jgi:hypothetical protein
MQDQNTCVTCRLLQIPFRPQLSATTAHFLPRHRRRNLQYLHRSPSESRQCQGPPVLGDGRTSSLLSYIFLYPYYPQVNAEARNHILCDALLIVNSHGYSGLYHRFNCFVVVWSHSGNGWSMDGRHTTNTLSSRTSLRELSQSARTPLSGLMIV